MTIERKAVSCPVCNGASEHKSYIGGRNEVYKVVISCPNELCQYYYRCQYGESKEVLGPIEIRFSINGADEPHRPEAFELLRRLGDHRRQALKESRALWLNTEAQLIRECFYSPNANKEGLAERYFSWLEKHQTQFPLSFEGLKHRIETNARKQAKRKRNQDNSDRDDNE